MTAFISTLLLDNFQKTQNIPENFLTKQMLLKLFLKRLKVKLNID
jgi:hypothetical protein